MSAEPVINLEMERQVLGSLMLTTADRVQAVQVDSGLKADHLYFDKHRAILGAVLAVAGEADPDELLVAAELERRDGLKEAGGANYLSELCATVSAPANVLHHTRVVIEAAEWRSKQTAAGLIAEAVEGRDRAKLGEAEALLTKEIVHAASTYNPAALQAVAQKLLTHEGAETFPWPLGKLNELTDGGMRRGEFIVLGGHTSHGKSVLLDQTLNGMTSLGKQCHLYINETTIEERVARSLARATGIPYSKIIRNRLSSEERETLTRAAPKALAFGITNCAGWDAEQIGHHIRRNRWDVAAVDILHLIPHEETKDLEQIAGTFARVAQQADCAILATVHLNRNRIKTAKVPRPTNADIKGASAFEQNANTVCFVWREQNATGIPQPHGVVYFTKVRNGRLGETWVDLNGERYRFESNYRGNDGDPGPAPPVEEPAPVEDPLPF